LTQYIGIGVNLIGIKQARNALGQFDVRMSTEEITDTIRSAGEKSLIRMRSAMRATWDQGDQRIANSLALRVNSMEDGNARIQFTVGNFKELEFVSAIGGDYKPGPYLIVPKRHQYLRFFWKRRGRVVRLPKVVHPGFPIDVIVDSGNREAEFLALEATRRFNLIVSETFQE